MASIDKRIAAIDTQIEKLEAQKDELQRKRMVRCRHCNHATRIDKLVYFDVMAYEEPYGCTGGDYWYVREGAFFCPRVECAKRNRLYYAERDGKIVYQGHPSSKKLMGLKRFFKAVEKHYLER